MDRLSRPSGSAAQVLRYLKNHPDFFRENPAFLNELSIPHLPGTGVSSLIEKQVQNLRTRERQLEQQLQAEKIKSLSRNVLLDRVLRSSLQLQKTKCLDSFSMNLGLVMQELFQADFTRCFVFSDSVNVHPTDCIEVSSGSSFLRRMFIEIINRGKALCGSLQEAHIAALFPTHEDRIHSTLMIPLQIDSGECLLVLGSSRKGLYGQDAEERE